MPMFEPIRNIPVFADFIEFLHTKIRQIQILKDWNLDVQALISASL